MTANAQTSITGHKTSKAITATSTSNKRFNTKVVQVRRIGRTVILEPIEKRGWDPHYWESLKAMAPMDETIEPFKLEFNTIKPEDL